MEVVSASSGQTATVALVGTESVSSIRSMLKIEFDIEPKLQIILVHNKGEGSVKELKGGTLEDHGITLPLKNTEVFLFDKHSMAPGGVPPMEKLNRFYKGKMVSDGADTRVILANMKNVFDLQRSQVEDLIVRQNNQVKACKVAVALLNQNTEIFRDVLVGFEQKWKNIALQHPALISATAENVERLKATKIRPELGLNVGRTLWDLYNQKSEVEMIMYAKKSQHDHDTLGAKLKQHLDLCHRTLSDVDELVNRSYEEFEPLNSAKHTLTKLLQATIPFLETKLIQNNNKVSEEIMGELKKAEQTYIASVNDAETFINNHTLSLQCVRLQKVTSLTRTVWQLQEQMRGVLGVAVEHLTERFHVLLILHELPNLQGSLADEALKRTVFRHRISASLRALERSLEDFLVDEMNRRANFLSDKHPFVREFLLSKFEWIKDDPLNLNFPSGPGFDRRLPKAVVNMARDFDGESFVNIRKKGDADDSMMNDSTMSNTSNPNLLSNLSNPNLSGIASSPPPVEKGKEEAHEQEGTVEEGGKPEDKNGNSNNDNNAAVDEGSDKKKDEENDSKSSDGELTKDEQMEEYEARIAYLEQQLAKRVERTTSQISQLRLENQKKEERLVEENSMLKSELGLMEQSMSMQRSENSNDSSNQLGKSMVVVAGYDVGDRVAFFKNSESGFYEAIQSKHVYLSEVNCDAFTNMNLPPSFCGTIVAKPEVQRAEKGNYFKLPENTDYMELTIELEI